MTGCANVGVVVGATPASASHAAFTPADVTPSQKLVVIVLICEILRNGLADPELVRMIVGSRVTGIRKPPLALVRDRAARTDACSAGSRALISPWFLSRFLNARW
jgi:hypothetical protein